MSFWSGKTFQCLLQTRYIRSAHFAFSNARANVLLSGYRENLLGHIRVYVLDAFKFLANAFAPAFGKNTFSELA